MKTVVYAGGCFWCTEHDLKHLKGVFSATSGYAREQSSRVETDEGHSRIPTYQNHEGAREAVRIEYDEALTNFTTLTQFFLDSIDPTDAGGQFYDRGNAYKTGIFTQSDAERVRAQELIDELSESGIYDKPVAVEVLGEAEFFDAESYHQNYAETNARSYERYRAGSGREAYVANTCRLRAEFPWKART